MRHVRAWYHDHGGHGCGRGRHVGKWDGGSLGGALAPVYGARVAVGD
jgi:hypothetical protein